MNPENNPFEAGTRKVIPAVLIYVSHQGRTLMIHRVKREGDFHLGKWNGLGGKLEADESPLEGAIRELREESGMALPDSAFRCLGVLQFPNFKSPKNEDWMVFVFRAEAETDLVTANSNEGNLHWVDDGAIPGLNLWQGDPLFLPRVLAGRKFIGTIWYEGEKVLRHWIQEL